MAAAMGHVLAGCKECTKNIEGVRMDPIVYIEYSFTTANISQEELEEFSAKFWNANRRYVEQRAFAVYGPTKYAVVQRRTQSHPDGKIVTFRKVKPRLNQFG